MIKSIIRLGVFTIALICFSNITIAQKKNNKKAKTTISSKKKNQSSKKTVSKKKKPIRKIYNPNSICSSLHKILPSPFMLQLLQTLKLFSVSLCKSSISLKEIKKQTLSQSAKMLHIQYKSSQIPSPFSRLFLSSTNSVLAIPQAKASSFVH